VLPASSLLRDALTSGEDMSRIALLWSLLLVFVVATSVAQVPAGSRTGGPLRPGPARAVWVRAELAHRATARVPLGGFLGPGDQDYRYTGFFIGAWLGLAATTFAVAWCSDPDNSCSSGRALLLGPVVSAALGVGGAVIGGLFPKAPPEVPALKS
jgi:hypothetical protein